MLQKALEILQWVQDIVSATEVVLDPVTERGIGIRNETVRRPETEIATRTESETGTGTVTATGIATGIGTATGTDIALRGTWLRVCKCAAYTHHVHSVLQWPVYSAGTRSESAAGAATAIRTSAGAALARAPGVAVAAGSLKTGNIMFTYVSTAQD